MAVETRVEQVQSDPDVGLLTAWLLDSIRGELFALLAELETLGYLRRRPDPRDRRGKLIVPTGRGREEREQADLILADIEARHAARIGADSYAEFRRLLRALVLPV